MNINGQSEIKPVRSILLKHPKDAFISQQNINDQWLELNYTGTPDFSAALEEYEAFIELLRRQVEEFHFLPQDDRTGLDSIYLHDPVVITKRGAILCSMGKKQRGGEPGACEKFLSQIGVPILGSIKGDGRLEGGDIVWLDERTLAVGQGYRTNAEGIRQLKELTSDLVDEFVVVPLPHWDGPDDVLHLMSMISPIDFDLALVYSRLMPVPFRQWLVDRGMKLVEVPDEEYLTMGCNVLAIAPRECIMLAGNPLTMALLEEEGVQVSEYKGKEISRKGAGGPTCLTRPLLRME
ncbi:MAG: arginine deiminase family protein [Candidatus Zixiibacteriota bacterium]